MSLKDAVIYIILSSLDMGDSLLDEAEYLADRAEIEYDNIIDTADDILNRALDQLISTRSAAICEYLKYYFTDEYVVDHIFDAVVRSPGHLFDSEMYTAIKTLYTDIGSFPGGRVIQLAIQDNILDPLGDYNIDASRVGSQIGHIYWRYVTRPEYGEVSNSGASTGHRENIDGYVYQFSKDISSYYFKDDFPGQIIPWCVGFICRFREAERDVIADIFAFARRGPDDEVVESLPAYSITISEFDDTALDQASQIIADYFNDGVEYAIDFGITMYN